MSKNKKIYHPERGDICFMDLNPQKGVEQAKRRPVLVVSDCEFNEKIGLAFVCPITSRPPRHGFHIKLDNRLLTMGSVMIEQLKSLDYLSRRASFIEKAPDSILVIVTDILKEILKN
ncbi:MAG: type II toxin-antitoxin system PemK/MazF family toxin [Oligoflexales bacterium]|nr:type II toxin-antitoxin system PemK/MazF family toxin [Oligoflexales bacterium]